MFVYYAHLLVKHICKTRFCTLQKSSEIATFPEVGIELSQSGQTLSYYCPKYFKFMEIYHLLRVMIQVNTLIPAFMARLIS